MLFGDVVLFAGIFRQIEQLGLAREQGDLDEFPVARVDGPAEGFDVDQNVFVRTRFALRQGRPDIFTSNGWSGLPLPLARVSSSVGVTS